MVGKNPQSTLYGGINALDDVLCATAPALRELALSGIMPLTAECPLVARQISY